MVLLLCQGGGVALLVALESPDLFSGVLLSGPMIVANPEEATRARVTSVPNRLLN